MTQGKYGDVNGLQLYYKVHGRERPVILHPGTTRITVIYCAGWLVSRIEDFSEAPTLCAG